MAPPSIYAHMLNGFFLLLAFFFLFSNFKKVKNMDQIKIMKLCLFISVAVGIHAISHASLEYIYGFNPLTFYFN